MTHASDHRICLGFDRRDTCKTAGLSSTSKVPCRSWLVEALLMPLMHPAARPPDALTEKSVGRTLAQVIKLHANVSAAGRWTRAIPVERGYPLHFVAQWSRAAHLLAVKVQFGPVSHSQHHRRLLHPRCRALSMRLHHLCPLDSLGAKKSIGTNGLCPALTGARNARRWPGRKPLQQSFARRSRRGSPRSNASNSSSTHVPDSVPIRTRKSESKR
jgi:hypothetical protein